MIAMKRDLRRIFSKSSFFSILTTNPINTINISAQYLNFLIHFSHQFETDHLSSTITRKNEQKYSHNNFSSVKEIIHNNCSTNLSSRWSKWNHINRMMLQYTYTITIDYCECLQRDIQIDKFIFNGWWA